MSYEDWSQIVASQQAVELEQKYHVFITKLVGERLLKLLYEPVERRRGEVGVVLDLDKGIPTIRHVEDDLIFAFEEEDGMDVFRREQAFAQEQVFVPLDIVTTVLSERVGGSRFAPLPFIAEERYQVVVSKRYTFRNQARRAPVTGGKQWEVRSPKTRVKRIDEEAIPPQVHVIFLGDQRHQMHRPHHVWARRYEEWFSLILQQHNYQKITATHLIPANTVETGVVEVDMDKFYRRPRKPRESDRNIARFDSSIVALFTYCRQLIKATLAEHPNTQFFVMNYISAHYEKEEMNQVLDITNELAELTRLVGFIRFTTGTNPPNLYNLIEKYYKIKRAPSHITTGLLNSLPGTLTQTLSFFAKNCLAPVAVE